MALQPLRWMLLSENYLKNVKIKRLNRSIPLSFLAGECHAGISSTHHYDRHGHARCKDCIGIDKNDCNHRKFCAGKAWRNMVYRIVGWYGVEWGIVQKNIELNTMNRTIKDEGVNGVKRLATKSQKILLTTDKTK